MEQRVLAIIPAYNEEENIASAVDDIVQNAPGVDYVVVDDGSRDATARICSESGYHFVSLPVNLGLAGAFQTGMQYALIHGYDYVVQFDADGQHSAAFIKDMVACAQETSADIVIGSRFVGERKPLSARMIGSMLITGILRLTTGRKITDPTSGMRLFDRWMIPLFANQFDLGPEPDSLAIVIRSGAKVSEIKVEMRERVAGESYLTLTKSVRYMLSMCISILFVQWFRKKVPLCR